MFLWFGGAHKKTNTSSRPVFVAVTQPRMSRCSSEAEQMENGAGSPGLTHETTGVHCFTPDVCQLVCLVVFTD